MSPTNITITSTVRLWKLKMWGDLRPSEMHGSMMHQISSDFLLKAQAQPLGVQRKLAKKAPKHPRRERCSSLPVAPSPKRQVNQSNLAHRSHPHSSALREIIIEDLVRVPYSRFVQASSTSLMQDESLSANRMILLIPAMRLYGT